MSRISTDSLLSRATGLPLSTPCVFFQANALRSPAPAMSVDGGVTDDATRYHQVWFRNATNLCASASVNFSNAIEARRR